MKRLCALALLLTIATTAHAEQPAKSKGQLVYVPAYSHIYIGDRERPFLLAITLAIRNTSVSESISIVSADYFDSDGQLLKQYAPKAQVLGKLSSARYTVPESDKTGGSGAVFLVRWESKNPVTPPIVETVMVGTGGQQGVSFSSRGEVLSEKE